MAKSRLYRFPSQFASPTGRAMMVERHHQSFIARVAKLAEKPRLSVAEIAAILEMEPASFETTILDKMRALPWLGVDRNEEGIVLHIDHWLRERCEFLRARPQLGMKPMAVWLADFQVEIKRRRKDNHDEMSRGSWNPENVLKIKQHELLNFIEEELKQLAKALHSEEPEATGPAGADSAAEKENLNGNQENPG